MNPSAGPTGLTADDPTTLPPLRRGTLVAILALTLVLASALAYLWWSTFPDNGGDDHATGALAAGIDP